MKTTAGTRLTHRVSASVKSIKKIPTRSMFESQCLIEYGLRPTAYRSATRMSEGLRPRGVPGPDPMFTIDSHRLTLQCLCDMTTRHVGPAYNTYRYRIVIMRKGCPSIHSRHHTRSSGRSRQCSQIRDPGLQASDHVLSEPPNIPANQQYGEQGWRQAENYGPHTLMTIYIQCRSLRQ